MPTNRSIIDATSGGALVDKTPEVAHQLILNMAANSKQFGTRGDAHQLILNMAANSKQFGTRGDFSNKRVNEVSISTLKIKLMILLLLCVLWLVEMYSR